MSLGKNPKQHQVIESIRDLETNKADTNHTHAKYEYYGTCATAAATTAKVVTCSAFTSLTTGAVITVKFTYANSIRGVTLNVNNTGAKYIRYRNSSTSTNILTGYLIPWKAYDTLTFRYDGTYWVVVGHLDTTYTLSSFGVTATSTELNYCDGVTSNIQTQLDAKADSSSVPTKTSDLENDSGFICIADIPEPDIPTKTSDLENDSGFITSAPVTSVVGQNGDITAAQIRTAIFQQGVCTSATYVTYNKYTATITGLENVDIVDGTEVEVKFTFNSQKDSTAMHGTYYLSVNGITEKPLVTKITPGYIDGTSATSYANTAGYRPVTIADNDIYAGAWSANDVLRIRYRNETINIVSLLNPDELNATTTGYWEVVRNCTQSIDVCPQEFACPNYKIANADTYLLTTSSTTRKYMYTPRTDGYLMFKHLSEPTDYGSFSVYFVDNTSYSTLMSAGYTKLDNWSNTDTGKYRIFGVRGLRYNHAQTQFCPVKAMNTYMIYLYGNYTVYFVPRNAGSGGYYGSMTATPPYNPST